MSIIRQPIVSGSPFSVDALALDSGAQQPIHQIGGSDGNPIAPAQDGTDATGVTAPTGGAGMRGWLSGIYKLLSGVLTTATFAPIRGATVALTAGPSATTAPVALPACTATTYRARNAAASASPITWTLSTNNTTPPVLPVPYSTAGTGGTAGDKTLDPGTVGIFGLTTAQQSALAAGTLYLSAITPSGGSATLTITPGNGS